MICIHCGVGLKDDPMDGLYTHVSGLQRCQSAEVPYGHMGHPELPCPPGDINPCMGYYRESGNCVHIFEQD